MDVWAAWDASLELRGLVDTTRGLDINTDETGTHFDFDDPTNSPASNAYPSLSGNGREPFRAPSDVAQPLSRLDSQRAGFFTNHSTSLPSHEDTRFSYNVHFYSHRGRPDWMDPKQNPSLNVRIPSHPSSHYSTTAQTPVLDSPDNLDISDFVGFDSRCPPGAGAIISLGNNLLIGHHRKHGKVALKKPRITGNQPKCEVFRRIERAACLWRSVRHRYILPFLGILRQDDQVFLVTPWTDSTNLLDALEMNPHLNKTQLLLNICLAVLYLHQRGIIHGDIRAQNVLLLDRGSPLLCDSDLAKVPPAAQASPDGKGVNSAIYMAPELFENQPKTTKSDVYAFGMLIAEVLTGQPYYPSFRDAQANMSVISGQPFPGQPCQPMPDQSYRELWRLAGRCWASNQDERPSMEAVYGELAGMMLCDPSGYFNRA